MSRGYRHGGLVDIVSLFGCGSRGGYDVARIVRGCLMSMSGRRILDGAIGLLS